MRILIFVLAAVMAVPAAADPNQSGRILESVVVHNPTVALAVDSDLKIAWGDAGEFWCIHDSAGTVFECGNATGDWMTVQEGGIVVAFPGGITTASIVAAGTIETSNAAGPKLQDETSSASNPTLLPNKGSGSTGIGGASGNVSIIGSGAEKLRVNSGGILQPNNVPYFYGTSSAPASSHRFEFDTAQTPPTFLWGVDTNSGIILIHAHGDEATTWDFAQELNPTIVVVSSDETQTGDRMFIQHNQDDAVVGWGNGNLLSEPRLANGATQALTPTKEVITFQGGGGDATQTTTGHVVAGSFLKAVTGRVTTTGTTCTSMDVGDGSTVDIYGDNVAVSAGTTFNVPKFNFANPQIAASEVIITGVGGNCVDLVVRLVSWAEVFTAPTD